MGASLTAQLLVNVLLALGRGDAVPPADLDKAGNYLCSMVESKERYKVTIGKSTIWCNPKGPALEVG